LVYVSGDEMQLGKDAIWLGVMPGLSGRFGECCATPRPAALGRERQSTWPKSSAWNAALQRVCFEPNPTKCCATLEWRLLKLLEKQ
jgi:hypothetical protein